MENIFLERIGRIIEARLSFFRSKYLYFKLIFKAITRNNNQVFLVRPFFRFIKELIN